LRRGEADRDEFRNLRLGDLLQRVVGAVHVRHLAAIGGPLPGGRRREEAAGMTGQEHVNPRLAAALRYASAGWPVLPVIPGEKVPATPHGFHDASTDPARIASWWKASPGRNVGVATGAPGPDVLDIDRHPDGSGFPALNRLLRAGLVPRPLAIVRTPGGGIHAYYQGTEQRNGHIPAEHVDFRGRGGYVVAPPSAVGSRRYEIMRHEPGEATFDWDAARRLLDPQPEPAGRTAEHAGGRPCDVTRLAGWVAAQREGNRNAGLFWAASRAVEAGDNSALDAIARGAAAAGLSQREITATIRSAQRGQERRPFTPEPEAG
jgi:Bifunctional DNA primase/polymerase, N-terminal